MIFLRHPTPEVAPGTCYGRLDLDIAEVGFGQIEEALKTTPKAKRILASPALRCRELANRLAERDGITPEFDERLWEMHMGEFEGKLWNEIDRSVSEVWFKDPYNLRTPGGESFRDLQVRVVDALQTADLHTAVVCHAGPIRAVRMAWENKTFKEVFSIQPGYAQPVRIIPPRLV